jgi:phenylpropionate dioxygenase-like ring-hydroxylating dioxygenase large terminal subunit
MTTLETDTDVSDEEVAVSPLSFPGSRYPTGWFQIAWSDDVAPGEMKHLHYFGQGIVLWRGESGKLNATDQHCLHLGGNLGVGGHVEGEDIVCPWHHWHWSGEGKNTLIPYSVQKCKPKLQLKTWDVRDWHGCVIVWFDELGLAPSWEPPDIEGMDNDEFYPVAHDMRFVARIKAHPQMVIENGGDPAHVMYVHGAGEMPRYENMKVEGPLWSADVSATYGAGRESTWLTPDGPTEVTVGFRNWGLGIGATVWPPEFMSTLMVICHAPVDEQYTDQFFWITARRTTPDSEEPPEGLGRFFEHQKAINAQDYFTWANMKVLPFPNFTPEEARPMASMRRWAWQFYPHGPQPKNLGSPKS